MFATRVPSARYSLLKVVVDLPGAETLFIALVSVLRPNSSGYRETVV